MEWIFEKTIALICSGTGAAAAGRTTWRAASVSHSGSGSVGSDTSACSVISGRCSSSARTATSGGCSSSSPSEGSSDDAGGSTQEWPPLDSMLSQPSLASDVRPDGDGGSDGVGVVVSDAGPLRSGPTAGSSGVVIGKVASSECEREGTPLERTHAHERDTQRRRNQRKQRKTNCNLCRLARLQTLVSALSRGVATGQATKPNQTQATSS